MPQCSCNFPLLVAVSFILLLLLLLLQHQRLKFHVHTSSCFIWLTHIAYFRIVFILLYRDIDVHFKIVFVCLLYATIVQRNSIKIKPILGRSKLCYVVFSCLKGNRFQCCKHPQSVFLAFEAFFKIIFTLSTNISQLM